MTTLISRTNVSDETLFEESYQRLLPELEALSAEDFVEINLEIPAAVATALGVLPQLNALREDIVRHLPNFDIARFDRLEDYTMALSYANAKHATATRNPDGLTELTDEGMALRATLQNDILALIGRNLINAAAVKNYSSLTGPKNIATDLQIQAHVLKDNWERVEGKCATTRVEVEHALKVAAHLLRLAGLKEQSPAVLAQATEIRLRAFTLFTRAYDDARRAVIYLRWHEDDADEIAPSLYAGRRGARKKPVDHETAAADPPNPIDAAAPPAASGGTNQGSTADAHAASNTAPGTTNPFLV